jgi:hypothetical protein
MAVGDGGADDGRDRRLIVSQSILQLPSNNNLVTWVRRVAKILDLESLRLLWMHGCAAAPTSDNKPTKAPFEETDV